MEEIACTSGAHHGAIVKEIYISKASFNSCSFVFEGHASNVESHNLAKFSHSLDQGRHIWMRKPHYINYTPLVMNPDT